MNKNNFIIIFLLGIFVMGIAISNHKPYYEPHPGYFLLQKISRTFEKPDDLAQLYLFGDNKLLYADKETLEAAIQEGESLLEHNPNHIKLLRQLAVLYHLNKDYGKAKSSYKNALKQILWRNTLYENMVQNYYTTEPASSYEPELDIKPKKPTLYAQENPIAFDKALRTKRILLGLAAISAELEDVSDMMRYYKRYLRAHYHKNVYNNLVKDISIMSVRMKIFAEIDALGGEHLFKNISVEYFKRLSEESSDNMEILYQLGINSANLADAIKPFGQTFPPQGMTNAQCDWCNAFEEYEQLAEEYLNKYIELAVVPERWETSQLEDRNKYGLALIALAGIDKRKNKYLAAIKKYNKLLTTDSWDAYSLYTIYLIPCYEKVGMQETMIQAEKIVNKLLENR